MVDMVLLYHEGPIQKFRLTLPCGCGEAIGRWLLILSRNGIKDLDLSSYYNLKIPSRLISCSVLEHLTVRYCIINIPLHFEGFKQLRTLILRRCRLMGMSIGNIVSSCPLLNHLNVDIVCPPQRQVRISAPNLTFLKIVASFNDICLETPKLASANFRLFPRHVVARNGKESNIVRVFGHLANIQRLKMNGAFFRYLATGPIPENLPTVLNHLTCIVVRELSAKSTEISAALCIFENAPNLKEVYIEFASDQGDVDVAWESKGIRGHSFKNLKFMKILCLFDFYIFGNVNIQSFQILKPVVLGFSKLVLSTAPVLEKLCFAGLHGLKIFPKMLKGFPKSSKNAEIIFEQW